MKKRESPDFRSPEVGISVIIFYFVNTCTSINANLSASQNLSEVTSLANASTITETKLGNALQLNDKFTDLLSPCQCFLGILFFTGN